MESSRSVALGLALALTALFAACVPDGTGTSSSGTGTSGGIASDAGDDGSSVDPQRAAICSAYSQATVTCCTNTPGTCANSSASALEKYCLNYAMTCTAMPTCFTGTDCNTLIYCGGGC